MAKNYKRIPLVVDAVFLADGTLRPKKIIINEGVFDIAKIIRTRNFCPRVVSCIAPIEYTIIVEGSEKKIYFEPDSGKWFSVKEVNL